MTYMALLNLVDISDWDFMILCLGLLALLSQLTFHDMFPTLLKPFCDLYFGVPLTIGTSCYCFQLYGIHKFCLNVLNDEIYFPSVK